jgi:mannose-6-phosphate isomerase
VHLARLKVYSFLAHDQNAGMQTLPALDQPLSFVPLYMERVWGGRRLADELGRALVTQTPIGESWELVDRDNEQSVVRSGPLQGVTLHELWTKYRQQIFGPSAPESPRFPLLGKILDARDTLSVQVHPPASIAASLNGEPKTEMWYLLSATEDAALYAGFQNGTTKESFEAALENGLVQSTLHRIPVRAGDAMFIPSGRCHAIAAGCLIVEIQQNSDTTYRLYDWDRVGLDGKPRALHIKESLLATDFDDHEPRLAQLKGESLVSCEYFDVSVWELTGPRTEESLAGVMFIVTSGTVTCGGETFQIGDWFLLPACSKDRVLQPQGPSATLLRCVFPETSA